MNSLTRYEQETTVNFNAEEKIASVYTADPNVMRKLDKLCSKYPDHYKCVESDAYSKTYEIVSKKLISFRSPRIITEEEREELIERLKQINSNNT